MSRSGAYYIGTGIDIGIGIRIDIGIGIGVGRALRLECSLAGTCWLVLSGNLGLC
jgi:hypothetical protein